MVITFSVGHFVRNWNNETLSAVEFTRMVTSTWTQRKGAVWMMVNEDTTPQWKLKRQMPDKQWVNQPTSTGHVQYNRMEYSSDDGWTPLDIFHFSFSSRTTIQIKNITQLSGFRWRCGSRTLQFIFWCWQDATWCEIVSLSEETF